MARARGINAHPVFKLGNAAARTDRRILMFAALLKAGPALPSAYDFDTTHPGIPTPMFGNDANGDCIGNVHVSGYTSSGPVCVTWGRKQQMTWAWLDKYCDEAYAICDAKDSFKKTMIDKAKIPAFLKAR